MDIVASLGLPILFVQLVLLIHPLSRISYHFGVDEAFNFLILSYCDPAMLEILLHFYEVHWPVLQVEICQSLPYKICSDTIYSDAELLGMDGIMIWKRLASNRRLYCCVRCEAAASYSFASQCGSHHNLQLHSPTSCFHMSLMIWSIQPCRILNCWCEEDHPPKDPWDWSRFGTLPNGKAHALSSTCRVSSTWSCEKIRAKKKTVGSAFQASTESMTGIACIWPVWQAEVLVVLCRKTWKKTAVAQQIGICWVSEALGQSCHAGFKETDYSAKNDRAASTGLTVACGTPSRTVLSSTCWSDFRLHLLEMSAFPLGLWLWGQLPSRPFPK